MKTPLLLGIITALLFSSFALSGMMVQAGANPNEITTVDGPEEFWDGLSVTSTAQCTMTHQVIGGGIKLYHPTLGNPAFDIIHENLDLATNSYKVTIDGFISTGTVQAFAICQKINFPMNMGSMIGGELLDLDTMALFVGAIGVNPVITGLVGITIAGITGQAVWFVYRRRKSVNS